MSTASEFATTGTVRSARSAPNDRVRKALHLALGAGLLLMLGADLPGHMSYNSVAQLYEGHFHVRETWGPAIYAWLLELSDAVIPGASVLVTAMGLLFFGSLALLARVRGRATWWSVAFVVLMSLSPQVLIFQGIVWKDIAFANTAIGGTACLAMAFLHWDRPRVRWAWLLAVLPLFAVASMVRQNGVIIPLCASLAVGLVGSRGQWRWFFAWMGGSLLALVALIQLLTVFATPQIGFKEGGVGVGLRIVQNYDFAAAVSLDPSFKLDVIAQVDPNSAQLIHDFAPKNWSPDRIDFLDNDIALGSAFGQTPADVATKQWLDLIFRHPSLYLKVRWTEFRWLLFTPQIDRCLPNFIGVDAPVAKMKALGLPHRFSKSDRQLSNYDTYLMDTPLQRHWPFAIMALVVLGMTLWRRERPDLAVAALMLGTLGVTASFLIITIACDYRYLYVLDLAGMTGLFYVLLDPAGFRRGTGHAGAD